MGSIVHRSVPTNLKWFPNCSHAHALFQDRFKDVQVGSRWFSTLYILSPNFHTPSWTVVLYTEVPVDYHTVCKTTKFWTHTTKFQTSPTKIHAQQLSRGLAHRKLENGLGFKNVLRKMVMGYGRLVSFWVTHSLELSSQLLHKVLFENVCHLETLVFETVSRLSSSSHQSKGKLASMVLPLETTLVSSLSGYWEDPQRIPRYPCRWHVTLGIRSLKLGSSTQKPKQTEQIFQTRFSKCLATVHVSWNLGF